MQAKISEEKLEKWADYLLDHSLEGIDEDDVVMLKGEYISWPLIQVLKKKIIKAGAVPDVFLVEPDNDRGQVWSAAMAKYGTMDQIKRVPDWVEERYDNMTKYIEILGAESPVLFANLPDKKSAAIKKADMPFKEIRLSKPWVLTLYPTKAFADMENMSLEEYTDVVMSTTLTDPNELDAIEQPIYEVMDASDRVMIETVHPDENRDLKLTMSIKDRNIIKCTGKNNFPDGEVFTSPDANSVEGEIFVDLPVFFNGVNIRGIYLKIENGKIVDYDAQENAETLKSIIETDKGSHRIGEVAVGMNKGLETALKHPLFVEKVGGTLHIAIGESYPECYVDEPHSEEGQQKIDKLKETGVVNSSAQHVDIVVDFRKGGVGKAVHFDDKEIRSEDNIWKVE
ncbi:MAG: aminopeptidase [Candidatus Marinimicrobia bacterium]|nr:aminopeptidase [Candidatus Neomarinimicrobiota bacterium]